MKYVITEDCLAVNTCIETKETNMKIYLSKSKNYDIVQYQEIKANLIKFGATIVEYTGGPYSAKPMLECDHLLVIPPKQSYDKFYVGKGIYDTIKTWHVKMPFSNAFFIYGSDCEGFVLGAITKAFVAGSNWQDQYAWYTKELANIVSSEEKLREILGVIELPKEDKSSVVEDFINTVYIPVTKKETTNKY